MINSLKILKLPARYGERSVTVIGWCVRTGYLEYALLPGWRLIRTRVWKAADRLASIASDGMRADDNHYYTTEPAKCVREIMGSHVRASLVCSPAAFPELPRPANWDAICAGEVAPTNVVPA
jgi:hypothetical protein